MATSQKSTTLCNKLLGGASGDCFQNLFNLGRIRIFKGAVPASADDPETSSSLLCVVKNGVNGITFDDPVDGEIAKAVAETWSGTNVADGTATHFRLVEAGYTDGGADSATQCVMQGTIGTGGNVVMVLQSTTFTNGATFTLPTYTVSLNPG